MRLVIYSNMPAPHMVPFVKELAAMYKSNCVRFVHSQPLSTERQLLGWPRYDYDWIVDESKDKLIADEWLSSSDVLLSGNFDVELFERRLDKGVCSVYGSERWLKGRWGALRLLHPKFLRKVWKIASFFRQRDFYYFAYGIHSAKDMIRLVGLVNGDLKCLMKAPEIDFEKRPGGRIWLKDPKKDPDVYGVEKIRVWGYSVERASNYARHSRHSPLRVLWVGRMLKVKRVDTIIRAVAEMSDVRLNLYGNGSARPHLEKLASKYRDKIAFNDAVSIGEVRGLMRDNDVFVFSSDSGEGWGAVVNEALEEGMSVIGTYEAGSSATILPDEALFHAGDVKTLKEKLADPPPAVGIGAWSLRNMANAFIEFIQGHIDA